MRKVILYIAMSLDGYIADENGGVGWLSGQDPEGESEGSYPEFVRGIDTVVMGWETYHQVITELSPGEWVYEDLMTYVITHREETSTEKIRFVHEAPSDLIQNLKETKGKDIWICGGASIAEQLMQEGASGTMVEDRADVPDPDKPNGFWEIIDPDLIQRMPEDVVVHAWFEPDHRYADRMQALRDRLSQWRRMELGMELGSLEIETQDVKEEDWAEVWKRFYKPFHAGRSLVVGLGRSACADLMGIKPPMSEIANVMTTVRICGEDIDFLPTYHPAACIYRKEARERLAEAMSIVRSRL